MDIALVGIASTLVAVGGYLLVRRVLHRGEIAFGGWRYPISDSDKVWMARMALGEAGSCSSDKRPCAAVLWSVVSRWMTLPQYRRWSFEQLMRNFSTPVMYNCRRGDAAYCQRISSKSWEQIPLTVRTIVEEFVDGRLPNPVSGYNNFAAERAIASSSLRASELPPINVGGNVFIRDPGTEPGTVSIV